MRAACGRRTYASRRIYGHQDVVGGCSRFRRFRVDPPLVGANRETDDRRGGDGGDGGDGGGSGGSGGSGGGEGEGGEGEGEGGGGEGGGGGGGQEPVAEGVTEIPVLSIHSPFQEYA